MTTAESINYRTSKPIILNGVHDITICGYSINGGMLSCIELVNCHNIHITQCELLNSEGAALRLKGCANIVIEDCCVANVGSGIYSVNGIDIQVRNNKISRVDPAGMLIRFETTGPDGYKSGYCYTTNNMPLL